VKRVHHYLPATRDAVTLLGLQIAEARRRRQTSPSELAERAGITVPTLRKAERGEPTVAIGTVFELATLVGVDLFGVESEALPAAIRRGEERLALLPARVRRRDRDVDDAF
jgi:transcriptional regulator with XRE-family HTH domain